MEPPTRSKETTTLNLISDINMNWSLKSPSNLLTKSLLPEGLGDPHQWGLPTLETLAQISALHYASKNDFRTKLNEAIKARQERNKSAVGKVGYMTITDLRAVLRRYQEEGKCNEFKEEVAPPPQPPKKIKAKGHAGRPKKNTAAKEALPSPKAGGRPRKTPTTVPKTPIRPDGDSEEEEEEEEDDSEALLAGGKYQYLSRVRPVKVNLNPNASVAAKPLRKKPTRQARPQMFAPGGVIPQLSRAAAVVGKRGQDDDDDEKGDDRVRKRLSVGIVTVQEEDVRVPDDTGFLSPLTNVATPSAERRNKGNSRRLSRLQEYRVREPHWQQDAPLVEVEKTSIIDGDDDAATEEDVVMEDADLEEVLQGLEEIPDNATVAERLEMEELRLSMQQRIWRIKALRMQQRAGDGGEIARVEKKTGGRRALRSRKVKK